MQLIISLVRRRRKKIIWNWLREWYGPDPTDRENLITKIDNQPGRKDGGKGRPTHTNTHTHKKKGRKRKRKAPKKQNTTEKRKTKIYISNIIKHGIMNEATAWKKESDVVAGRNTNLWWRTLQSPPPRLPSFRFSSSDTCFVLLLFGVTLSFCSVKTH